MKKVLVSGINGKMGQILCRMIAEDPDMEVVCGFDTNTEQRGEAKIPIYDDVRYIKEKPDVIIDFSSPDGTNCMVEMASRYECPIVVATTGISDAMVNYMKTVVSNRIPVFYSRNMSYEICVLRRILEVAVPLLKGANIEILEVHHNGKADSPSGTADMLADTINEILNNEKKKTYGRTGKREDEEIGMASLRGGNICGTHTVYFFGASDTLEITHTAHSRDVFAEGAIRAAKFVTEKEREPGFYTMDNLFDNLF